MNIKIMGRKSIERLAERAFKPKTAVISISNSDCEFAKLKNKPQYLFQIKFDDVSDEIFEEILGRKPNEKEAKVVAEHFHMITDDQAEKIAEFYFEIRDKVDTLICQCEHGESRSAATAAAILEYGNKNGIAVFSDSRYYPNKLVYRKVLKALQNH